MESYPDTIFLVQPDESLLCSICLQAPVRPVRCNAEHLFCKSCINSWLDEGHESCPIDREVLTKSSLQCARMARNIISEYDVRCISCNEEGNRSSFLLAPCCSWVGKFKHLEDHLTHNCGHTDIQCTWEGCCWTGRRNDLASHVKDCNHRIETCEWCKSVALGIIMDGHRAICPSRPLSCKNRGCDEVFPLHEFILHEQFCQFAEVPCPYRRSIGCPHRCQRREMSAHILDASLHMACVISKVYISCKPSIHYNTTYTISAINTIYTL